MQAVENLTFYVQDYDVIGRHDALGEQFVDLSGLTQGVATAKSMKMLGAGILDVTLEAKDFGIPVGVCPVVGFVSLFVASTACVRSRASKSVCMCNSPAETWPG